MAAFALISRAANTPSYCKLTKRRLTQLSRIIADSKEEIKDVDIQHVAPLAIVIVTASPKTAHTETLAINPIAATTKVLTAMTTPKVAMIAATKEDAVMTAIKAGPTATLDANMVDAMKSAPASSIQAMMLIM